MDPITSSIVIVLGKYALDKTEELVKEVGPKALETAKEMFQTVLERVKRVDPRTVEKFPENPEGYNAPLTDALNEVMKTDPGFAAQLKALLEQYEKAAQEHAAATGTSYQATVAGSGVIAQDHSAVAETGGVAVGRDVGGHVVIAEQGANVAVGDVQTGGIRAGRIDADNVVDGVQMQGGDVETAAGLVELARAIKRGGISAEEIKAKSLVSGLQYIADPTQAAPDDLRHEVAALRRQLEEAIAAGEITDETDAEDAQDALVKAEEELRTPEPKGNRVVRKLAEVSEILTRSAEAVQGLGQVGAQVIRLAPIAATLWQIAQRLWGG
jgi:hypothetical protein